MAYSPSEKYPGAVDVDPDYQGGKFRDNNPSTTNNGSPLKAIDRNELLARDEAIMNDAGFKYNGLPDTPDDSQLFKAYKASLGNGANLLSNHNFLVQTPDDSQPAPSATPTSYPPGYQIFSGVFANETSGITNLTYIDGRVSFSGGDLYFAVPNTGGVERLTSDQLTASVADFDGKPRTRGVSFALVGDEYRVTVGVDALEDVSAALTPLGSVKFEQGSVATGHEVGSPVFRKISFSELPGGTDDDKVSFLINSKYNNVIIDRNVYLNADSTIPRDKNLYFVDSFKVNVSNGVTVNINSLVFSDHYPVGGEGSCLLNDYVIQVKPSGGDTSDPQDLNSMVPDIYWQNVKGQIHHGTYDVHVHIDNKWSGGALIGVPGQRATLTIYGVDDDSGTITPTTAQNVKIKSAMLTSCGGGAFNPVIGYMELTDINTYTDEKTQIEFYGCPSGADIGLRFRPTGGIEASGVFSYGSNISSENEDFGVNLLQWAYLTKHGGVISANGNTALNQGLSPKGKLILGIGTAVSGSIHISDSSGLTTDAYSRWNTSGAGNGFVYDQGEQSCYGIELLANSISAYHSYFTSLTDVQDASFSGGSVSLDEIGDGYKGLKVTSGSTSGAGTAQIRRVNTISRQSINARQSLKAAILIETLQADTAFEVGIGAKAVGQPFVYIEVTNTGVFGVYRDTSGVESKTQLADSSFIPNRMLTYEIDIIPNRTEVGSHTAVAIFRLSDENDITRKVVSLDIDQDSSNNIIWSATSRTSGANTMEAFLSELRVYRQS
ncbi:hypothetical protein NVP1181O_49 [Vibrio phage 1.181.O._10N.286.46.C9]|nr:hypothetical protein NVP1181O_49 [Vibrio phage 1.181.O._10N.286.46.C9]